MDKKVRGEKQAKGNGHLYLCRASLEVGLPRARRWLSFCHLAIVVYPRIPQANRGGPIVRVCFIFAPWPKCSHPGCEVTSPSAAGLLTAEVLSLLLPLCSVASVEAHRKGWLRCERG